VSPEVEARLFKQPVHSRAEPAALPRAWRYGHGSAGVLVEAPARLLEEPKDLFVTAPEAGSWCQNAPQSQVAVASIAAIIVASSSGSEPAYG
jgi:hypothetical protein